MRPNAYSSLLTVFLLCSVFFVTSCRTPQETLPATWANIENQWRETLEQDYNPEQPVALSWNDALARMREHNIKLQRAKLDIQRSKDNISQVYWNLMPLLNVQLRANTRLQDISSISWSNLTFDINSFINIPGLANMQSNLFGARLSLLRAELALLLAEREQTIELYQAFREFQILQQRLSFLEFSEQQANLWRNIDPFQSARQREELRKLRRSLEQQSDNLQQTLHRLIGLSPHWWQPQPETLPEWNYLKHPLVLEDMKQTGFLQSLLLATELEGEAARIQGIRLMYWPDLSISVTGPPLYQVANNKDKFWDAGEVQAFATVFWQVDTQGRIRRHLKQVEMESSIQQQELKLQSVEQARRLQQAQLLYADYVKELENLNKDLQWLQELLQAGQGADPVRNLQAVQTLADERTLLQQRIDEIVSMFWFVDERRWTFDSSHYLPEPTTAPHEH
jgi:hypothetical protein